MLVIPRPLGTVRPALPIWNRKALTTSYVTVVSSTSDTTNYTFSSTSLGTAEKSRVVFAFVGARFGTSSTPTGVTLDGNAMAAIGTGHANSMGFGAWFWIRKPSGTSGEFIVSTSGATSCLIAVHTVYNLLRAVTAYQASNGGDPTASLSPSIPKGSVGLAGCIVNNANSFTWAGLTERQDTAVENTTWSTASAEFASSSSPTITATRGGAAGTSNMRCIVLRP